MAKSSGRNLVVGPYVGELGWEVFSFQPLARALFLREKYDRCLAFVPPGRDWLYRFAETRSLLDTPKHEPECLAWANLQAHGKELSVLIGAMKEAAKAELGEGEKVDMLSYPELGMLNDPKLPQGLADLLRPDPGVRWSGFAHDGRKKVALCVRARDLSDHRNWSREHWEQLGCLLAKAYDVAVVGVAAGGESWDFGTGVSNRLNDTSINDLITAFSQADLAVGGSTGTLHLASRCGCDHLVWGAENATAFPLSVRYAETNWFGANHRLETDCAWNPAPEDVAGWVAESLGQWERKDKARVVIMFDDATVDNVDAALYAEKFGIRVTLCAVPSMVGTPGFATWDTLRMLHARGHVICNHSFAHRRLLSDKDRRHLVPAGKAGVTADAIAGRDELLRYGLDGDLYVAPFGTDNVAGTDHVKELAGLFRWIRLTIGAPHADGWTPGGRGRIYPGGFRGKVIGNSVASDMRNPGCVEEMVNAAVAVRGLCLVTYHTVSSVVGRDQNVTWANFTREVEHIRGHVEKGGAEVITARVLADEAGGR